VAHDFTCRGGAKYRQQSEAQADDLERRQFDISVPPEIQTETPPPSGRHCQAIEICVNMALEEPEEPDFVEAIGLARST